MKKFVFMLSMILFFNIAVSAEDIVLIKSDLEEPMVVNLNENGIITSITTTYKNLSYTDLIIKTDKPDEFAIHMKASGDGCFDIDLKKNKSTVTVTKHFISNQYFAPRDDLSYEISFAEKDFILKDPYVSIDKKLLKSFYSNSKDSFLPKIKYANGILYQCYGVTPPPANNPGSRKYVYSKDRTKVFCSKIMPGDIWHNFMNLELTDIKSDDVGVNVINYLILYLYNDMIGTLYFPILFDFEKTEYITGVTYRADSFLNENDVSYIAQNLDSDAGWPWVEGVEGDGIGTKIYISADELISKLVISNGFKTQKKQTYFNNNRVKELLVKDAKNPKNQKIITLLDTYEPFEIDLGFKSSSLILEIKSVYKGEKYQDTCINYILCK